MQSCSTPSQTTSAMGKVGSLVHYRRGSCGGCDNS